ncbi:MAG: hypothetical protein AAFP23_07655 [Pseudomonadota bacterium]
MAGDEDHTADRILEQLERGVEPERAVPTDAQFARVYHEISEQFRDLMEHPVIRREPALMRLLVQAMIAPDPEEMDHRIDLFCAAVAVHTGQAEKAPILLGEAAERARRAAHEAKKGLTDGARRARHRL